MRWLAGLVGVALAMPVLAEPDLGATWILTGGGRLHPPALTALGAPFQADYDFRYDDPSLLCIPASWTRVFSNPNTPFELTQYDDRVRIRHELFDVDRTVPLLQDDVPVEHRRGDNNFATLGDSVAWYDGDALLIHTVNYGDEVRVLSTIRNWAGLPQSPLMVTLERWRRDGDRLALTITHFDPVMYTEPLVASYRFRRESEWRVEPYECEPEDAGVVTPE